MFNRIKSGPKRTYGPEPEVSSDAFPLPRLWMVLLVLALPFFILSAHYFEALERSGTIGALIADTMLPATVIGYLVLVFMARKRKL